MDKRLINAAKETCRTLRRNSTPAEQKFWERVRNRRFQNLKFFRQYPFFFSVSDHDTFVVADFYCRELKIVVEIDGKIHETEIEHDAARSQYLSGLGVEVVRFTNEEIENAIDETLKKLALMIGAHERR